VALAALAGVVGEGASRRGDGGGETVDGAGGDLADEGGDVLGVGGGGQEGYHEERVTHVGWLLLGFDVIAGMCVSRSCRKRQLILYSE
jgi:hypothetical protein